MAISVSNLSFSVIPCDQNNIQSRIESSIYSKKPNSDKILRPKSTPIKFNPDGLDSFYLTPRTQTAPANTLGISDQNHICKRSMQVSTETVKQYRFPSANNRRVISTSQTSVKTPEESLKVYNLGPGYAMYRNDSEFTVKINSDEFFGPRKKTERESATKRYVQDHKDIMIGQLQEQLMNLTVALEEEKINHNLSITAWQEKLESTRSIIINNYEKDIEDMKEEHLMTIKNINQKHDNEMQQQKEELSQKINSSIRELNTYKASFESFRQSFIKETDETFEKQKSILLSEFEEELRNKLDRQKSFMTSNFEVDMERWKQEQSMEMEKIMARHGTEIQTLNKRFSDVAALEERLSHTIQELTKKKRDLESLQVDRDNLYEMYSSVRKEMTIVRCDNDNLKAELQEFSDRFEERVRRVDDDYKQRMDSLHNQIVEIRRAYMTKCEELIQERKNIDTQLHGRIENAKDVMKELIHTRQRARISLISLDSDTELDGVMARRRRSDNLATFTNSNSQPQPFGSHVTSGTANRIDAGCRPSSAPTTEKDEHQARQNIFLIGQDSI